MIVVRKAEVGAIFGLLLAGLSTEKIANILGRNNKFVRKIVPPDWMPPRHGHRRSLKERKEKKARLNAGAVIDHFSGGHYTLQETADAFGVTRERIRQILAKHGVSHRTQGTLPREIYEARLRRYQAALKPGVSTKQAAEASGVTYSEATRAAQALGVAMPKPTRASRIKYAEVAAYYEANPHLTGRAVAAHFGITPTTMSHALRIMGVKPRHSGWTHADDARSRRSDAGAAA